MRNLLLIKHAKPHVDPKLASERWELCEEGKQRCGPLAERVAQYAPVALFASEEPKARQTAELIGPRLGLSVQPWAGLHEHDRSNVPLMDTRDFLASMALAFRHPGERIIGRETLRQAEQRFDRAIGGAMATVGEGDVAMVAHGTVIALLVAQQNPDVEPYPLWRRMGLPSIAVVSWPNLELLEVIDRV